MLCLCAYHGAVCSLEIEHLLLVTILIIIGDFVDVDTICMEHFVIIIQIFMFLCVRFASMVKINVFIRQWR